MRSFLAALWILIVAGIARAEFDAAGVASAKPKTSGAAFDSVAANQRARRGWIIYDMTDGTEVVFLGDLKAGPPLRFVVRPVRRVVPVTQAPQPSNIPRPKR